MDTASQQRILGYFIEEAKEHLQTLEQGILQLSTAVKDTEMVNEMFRAAHSVKGGAAMLGYSTIQKTAHRLEDSFKVLREHPVNVDQKLESLFLTGYDYLQDLIERLESSPNFRDEDALEILEQAESNFTLLQNYLKELLAGNQSGITTSEASINIAEEIKETLKKMLSLFKQPDSPANRQQLQQLCQNLAKLAPEQPNWQNLIKTATLALANTKYPYNTVAQIVIKELKLCGDFLHGGQGEQIVPSNNLKQLAATATKTVPPGKVAQISIPVEPQAAAIALLKSFNKQQIAQIIKILSSQIQI
ncbi:putative CheA signal transduction histidine kinase [Stanieria sp. NIES-3757]|nr:putative CheA signal transduction histidine kinase [Stanieria sp. NIES-3757]